MQPPSLNMCGNLGLLVRPAAFANRGCELPRSAPLAVSHRSTSRLLACGGGAHRPVLERTFDAEVGVTDAGYDRHTRRQRAGLRLASQKLKLGAMNPSRILPGRCGGACLRVLG
jgi:hypothetical protein